MHGPSIETLQIARICMLPCVSEFLARRRNNLLEADWHGGLEDNTGRDADSSSYSNMPAMDAEIRFAMVPAIIARRPNEASSRFLLGARAPIPPICIPIEPRLANPQSAKVAIVNERGSSTAF